MYPNCVLLTATLLVQAIASAMDQVQAAQQPPVQTPLIFRRSSNMPLLAPSSSQLPCPGACNCKWSSGKPSAFCDSQSLISVPNGIDSEVQVLDLSKNNFQTLPSRVFQERKLTNLQRINLSYCNLGFIADDAFLQLTNLVELDFSSNLLTKLPIKSTKECKQMRKLYLSHNPITSIEANSFSALPELIVLDLSYCQIEQIETMAFYGLNNLKELKLNDNRLTTLKLSAVLDLPPQIYIDLTQNQWNCDCNLRALREWYTNGSIQSTLPPTCSTPSKVSDVMWTSLKLEDFACAPEIIPGNTEMTVPASMNVSLSCTVKASLPVTFVWFQDERNLMAKNNQSEPPSTTKLLEERRYDIYETVGPPNFPNISTSVLTLHQLRPTDSSTFLCWVENKAGYSITNFTLTVTEPGAVSDMWPPWSRRAEGTYLIIIVTIFAISMILATLIVTLLVKKRKVKEIPDIDHDLKPTPKIRHCSMSSVDDDNNSTSTDSSDSNSARKPQISSIGMDVIEHMKSGIINMDYHSMSPIIQFNNHTAANNNGNNMTTNTTSMGHALGTHNNTNANHDLTLRKSTTNELHIHPGSFNRMMAVNYNNPSANSSYNCDLTSSSTTGYHSDYNSGYSDEPNSAPNYNMMAMNEHSQQSLIGARMGLISTLDRQRHMAGAYHHPVAGVHYDQSQLHLSQQPPDITMIHDHQHHGHNTLASAYNHPDASSDMAMLSDMALPGYATTERSEASPLDYSKAV